MVQNLHSICEIHSYSNIIKSISQTNLAILKQRFKDIHEYLKHQEKLGSCIISSLQNYVVSFLIHFMCHHFSRKQWYSIKSKTTSHFTKAPITIQDLKLCFLNHVNLYLKQKGEFFLQKNNASKRTKFP